MQERSKNLWCSSLSYLYPRETFCPFIYEYNISMAKSTFLKQSLFQKNPKQRFGRWKRSGLIGNSTRSPGRQKKWTRKRHFYAYSDQHAGSPKKDNVSTLIRKLNKVGKKMDKKKTTFLHWCENSTQSPSRQKNGQEKGNVFTLIRKVNTFLIHSKQSALSGDPDCSLSTSARPTTFAYVLLSGEMKAIYDVNWYIKL